MGPSFLEQGGCCDSDRRDSTNPAIAIRLKSNMLNWRTSSINRYEDDGLFGVGNVGRQS